MASAYRPGATVRYRDHAWTVVDVAPFPTDLAPHSWTDTQTGAAIAVTLQAPDDPDTTAYVGVPDPTRLRRADADLAVIADPGECYPACPRCAQPWPCRNERDRRAAAAAVDALLADVAAAETKPHLCRWCVEFGPAGQPPGRTRTAAGLARHEATCRYNPAMATKDTR